MPPTLGNGKICYIATWSDHQSGDRQRGEIVQPIGMDAPEVTARFRDPGGNVFGLYQEPSHAARV